MSISRNFVNEGRPLSTDMQVLHFLREWIDGRSSGRGKLWLQLHASGKPCLIYEEYREGSSGGDSSWFFYLEVVPELAADLNKRQLIVGEPFVGGRHSDPLVISDAGKRYYDDRYMAMTLPEREIFREEMWGKRR